MAYATFSDIQSEFKDVTFSATTKVTQTEVENFITQQEASVNAKLSKIYEVPVVDTTDIEVIKAIVIKCVKGRVATILETKSPSIETDQQPSWLIMYREAKSELKSIVTGVMPLPNTPKVTENGGLESYGFSSKYDKNLPVFERGKPQW